MVKKTKKDNFEMNFYLGVVEKAPRFIEALSILGDMFTKKGEYKEGLEMDQRLASLRPDDPIVCYNLACSYSLLEQVDLAFQYIKKAIECGYDSFDYLDKDDDLFNLRQDERFKMYYFGLSENRKNKI